MTQSSQLVSLARVRAKKSAALPGLPDASNWLHGPQRLPAGDSAHALPCLRVVVDAREAPAQFERSRELAALLVDGADRSGLSLSDDEHLEDAGKAFEDYQDKTLRGLTCKRIQVDEIGAFVHCKAKNVATAKAAPKEAGDCWTWLAIDADTKLIPSFHVGARDGDAAQHFIGDLALRLANRVQLTSDGHKAYLEAIEQSFGADIDYAMLVKLYGDTPGEGRYSPGECIGAEKKRVEGRPDPKHISTSFAERANLTVRMGNRCFTRLTNAFSKKAENHLHSVAIHTMHYNFVRIHQTLRRSPAMAAGVTTKLWELSDMVKVLEDWEAAHGK